VNTNERGITFGALTEKYQHDNCSDTMAGLAGNIKQKLCKSAPFKPYYLRTAPFMVDCLVQTEKTMLSLAPNNTGYQILYGYVSPREAQPSNVTGFRRLHQYGLG